MRQRRGESVKKLALLNVYLHVCNGVDRQGGGANVRGFICPVRSSFALYLNEEERKPSDSECRPVPVVSVSFKETTLLTLS